MAQGDSIDRAALDELFESIGSDSEFMNEIIAEFFQDTPRQLAIIQNSLACREVLEFSARKVGPKVYTCPKAIAPNSASS